MNKILLVLVLILQVGNILSQETTYFIVRLTPTNDPSNITATGDLTLTGTKLIFKIDTVGCHRIASFYGPLSAGSVGPIMFQVDGGDCSVDSSNGFAGQTNLSAADAMIMRSGLASVVIDDVWQGQILPNSLCQTPGAMPIILTAILQGRDPANEHIPVRWGTADLILNGHLLKYQIELPSNYGPYTGGILVRGNRGFEVSTYFGTLSCVAEISNSSPARDGFDSLPKCSAQGSFCLSDNAVGDLLSARAPLAFTIPTSRFAIAGVVLPADSDGDGVPDFRDECPNTLPGAIVNSNGCSIEQLAPCEGSWRNHGEYVNRVKDVTADFLNSGLITDSQRKAIINQASQSRCGQTHPKNFEWSK